MIVEMDIGNSRIKWRARSKQSVLNGGVTESVAELLEELKNLEAPNKLLVASVRGDASLQKIAGWAEQHWQITPRLAVVSEQASGVTNSYCDVTRMGVDRWLAMLAAYNQTNSACLVVDGGTALTIDAINNDGLHLGGYILPGLKLAVHAIEENTGIHLQHHGFSPDAQLGDNTESAVLNGELAQVVALIEKVSNQLLTEAEDETRASVIKILLSGGDAALLEEALSKSPAIEVKISPTLVLDGLALADSRDYS